MRWNHPENYSLRTRTWFALLPVCLGGETRWLEYVTVAQQWCPFNPGGVRDGGYWKSLYFKDEQEEPQQTACD